MRSLAALALGFILHSWLLIRLEIQTLSYQDGAEPARWICDGSTSFEITEGNRTERGTDVILYINEDSEEFCRNTGSVKY